MKDASKKRVLFLVGQLHNGGLERQLFYLVKGLLGQGTNVACYVWNYEPDARYVGAFRNLLGEALIYPSKGANTTKKIRQLRRNLIKRDIDLAVSFSAFTNFRL